MKSVQIGIFCLIVGILGGGLVNEYQSVSPVRTVNVVGASVNSDEQIFSLIKDLSVSDKEALYKVYKGLADYCENVKRIRETHTIASIVAEVYLNYKLENVTQLDGYLASKMAEKGFDNKGLFQDRKNELTVIFNEIASGIKYSIEKNKEVK